MHIISIDDLDNDHIEGIFHAANNFENHRNNGIVIRHVLYNLFYEPSTRTSSSFYAASARLGGLIIPVNEVQYSSVVKGEVLEDTIRTAACYADVIVLRHPENGAAERAAYVSPVPVINAGDGNGEHPTQTLLDGYTIWKHYNQINGLNVTMMGDLKNGRTVHSLVKFLSRYNNIKINLVAPEKYQMPDQYMCDCCTRVEDLNEVVKKTDVLYMTRVQQERGSDFHYELTEENVKLFKDNMIVMHPLPRNQELPQWFDTDPRAKYFEQMKNGMFVRMAILYRMLK